MRLGRHKAARKALKFYSINANITPPFKIILDGNFLAASTKMKVPLFERLENLLHTPKFTVYVSRSALDELKILGFDEARQFGLDECEIMERKDIPDAKEDSNPKQDILNLVKNGNQDQWFVATQDVKLSDKIKDSPNVPLMRLGRGVLILESPSSRSRKNALREERTKQNSGGGTMTNDEREIVNRLNDESSRKRQRSSDDAFQRKKQKAKGPNPLSCKKKSDQIETNSNSKKRNRRKKSVGTIIR